MNHLVQKMPITCLNNAEMFDAFVCVGLWSTNDFVDVDTTCSYKSFVSSVQSVFLVMCIDYFEVNCFGENFVVFLMFFVTNFRYF